MKEYRICTKCEIHHYENCESYYGFGVYKISSRKDEAFPVTAGEAIEGDLPHGLVLACPECGSTEEGVPANRKIVV